VSVIGSAKLAGERPGLAVGDQIAVDRDDRQHIGGGAGKESLAREFRFGGGKGTLDELLALAPDDLDQRQTGDAI
jgi:hypothetical protein